MVVVVLWVWYCLVSCLWWGVGCGRAGVVAGVWGCARCWVPRLSWSGGGVSCAGCSVGWLVGVSVLFENCIVDVSIFVDFVLLW